MKTKIDLQDDIYNLLSKYLAEKCINDDFIPSKEDMIDSLNFFVEKFYSCDNESSSIC